MLQKYSLTLSLSLVLIVPVLLLGAGSTRADDADSGILRLLATLQVSGKPLNAFDISFVDQPSQTYYLADRSNARIDVVDARTSEVLKPIGAGLFVGADPRGNDFSGPDGVLEVHSRHQLWAGDGDSTAKVFNLKDPDEPPIVLFTGGKKRVDEMCYGAGLVVAANNSEDIDPADPKSGPFITFFSTNPPAIVGKIVFHEAGGGIEQCAFDRTTGLFYLSLPDGFVAEIDPSTMTVTRQFPVADCEPAGLATGPHHHLIIGCGNRTNTVVLDDTTGAVVARITQVGGSDEVWFNRGDGNYYLAARNNARGPVLGIIDADTNTFLGSVPTVNIPGDGSAHSVAANRANNHIFVPLPANSLPMYNSRGFHCTHGCIAVFASGEGDEED
jgi:hypothetical protein